MILRNHVQRLRVLDERIRNANTGRPEAFAKEIGVSRSHMYRLIELLRDMEARIAYCRHRKSFFYEQPFDLEKEMQVFIHTSGI